ncbi:MAG: hypothetical protein ACTS5A_02700 [Candidatus Hodgkinia cicadicola]
MCLNVRTSALRRLAPAEGLRLIERWIVDKWNAISVELHGTSEASTEDGWNMTFEGDICKLSIEGHEVKSSLFHRSERKIVRKPRLMVHCNGRSLRSGSLQKPGLMN